MKEKVEMVLLTAAAVFVGCVAAHAVEHYVMKPHAAKVLAETTTK